MADIRLVWNVDTQTADWQIVDGALDASADLETSVIASLFTWARADADDVLPAPDDRKGWLGDLDGDEIHGVKTVGSRLWLLTRELQTETTRQRAIAYVLEALQWLVDKAVVARMTVDATWQGRGFLTLAVRLYDPSGDALLDQHYAWAWQQMTA